MISWMYVFLSFLVACTAKPPAQLEKIEASTTTPTPMAPLPEGALTQTYQYFGCGGQSYIFFSEDGRYVLKFLKHKSFALPAWKRALPLLAHKALLKKRAKKQKVLEAFRLCATTCAQETGVLYAHLEESAGAPCPVAVKGLKGIPNEVDLNTHIFLLQERAVPTYAAIDQWVAAGRPDLAQRGVEALLRLHLSLLTKGVRNRDPKLHVNCGFVGMRPILFDIGRVISQEEMKQPELCAQEMERITAQFRAWLAEHHEGLEW